MPLGATRFAFSRSDEPYDENLAFLVTRFFGANIGIATDNPDNRCHWVIVQEFEQQQLLLTQL